MNLPPLNYVIRRFVAGTLLATAALGAWAQTDAARNGVTVSIPNGYANINVEDLRVQSTGGPVRWTRTWDGSEWKFNPSWESLSQSWKNLTGSQPLDTLDGTITRDPSQPLDRNSAILSAGGGNLGGCTIWVDEDWQPSGQTVTIAGVSASVMIPERVAPFNRFMGEAGTDYPPTLTLLVDWINLCPGGGMQSGPTAQDMEALRRGSELYVGNEGRFSFSARSIMEKRAVRQLPPLPAGTYGSLGTGQVTVAPLTLANGYRWMDKAGDWIDYSNRGQIVAWGDRNNNTLWLQRDASGIVRGVVDASGHVAFSLHYTGPLVTELRDYPVVGNALDLLSRSVKYEYDAASRLTKVTDARGFDTRYEYDERNRIVRITDPEGRIEQIAYNGELVAQRTAPDGAVNDYSFDYDDANRQLISKITGPESAAGRMVIDTTHNRAGKLVRRITNGRTDEEVKYDTAARAQTSTNARGFATRTTQSEFGQVIEIALPDGSAQKASYSALNLQLIDETDELGIRTEYLVDNAGNRLQKTEAVGTPDQRITEYVRNTLGQVTRVTIKGRTEASGMVTQDAVWQVDYDSLGQLERVIDAENHSHRFVFDRAGNTARYTDPRNNATRFEVDAHGNLTRAINALGHSTTLSYDKVGNQTSILNARNKTMQQVYDAMNRRTQVVNAVGGIYRTQFNGQGLPIRETDEDGRPKTYEFDNFQRLAKTADALANTTTLDYTVPDGNLPGQLGTLLLPNQVQYPTFTQQTKYDARERPTSQTLVHPNASGTENLVSSTSYDKRGQVVAETDANGKTRSFTYSALGRLIDATDALGNQTKAQYDVRGNLIQLEDAKGRITRFEYDRNDRLVKETLPLGQATRYQYDAAGNLSERTDPLGVKTTITFDDANRVTLTERRNSANALQRSTVTTWDEANNLSGWTDTDPTRSAGQQTASAVLSYDDANRKTGETVTYANGTILGYSYAYSAAGKKTRLTWADGTAIDYGYSAHGELQTVTIPGEGSIGVNQFKWTAPTSLTLPGGTVQDKTYDGLLNLESLKVKSPGQQTTLDLQNRYGKVQELSTRNRTDTAASASSTRSDSFGYDDEVRLTSAQTTIGVSTSTETFTLDALANRTAHSPMAGAWTYDNNNRLIQRGSGTGATTYTWDDAGNLATKVEPGKTTRYFYDTHNRLARVEDASGNLIARYGYDPFSRRIWKEHYRDGIGSPLAQARRTLYLYADEGLIAEATQDITLNADQSVTATGPAQIATQYGPKLDSLFGTDVTFVKTMNTNGVDTFAYLHRDHLGTPLQATDKAGSVVWVASYDPFGRADIVTPAATTGRPLVALNLRLPGQYFDEETGLHYNWHRYYDSQVGGYVTEDPIGIEGGVNRYAYVNGNPLSHIDPYGLQVGPPGTAESFVPIWGSGREAIDDFQNGRYAWGTVNGALAASDVFLIGTTVKAFCKGAWKTGSHAWKATRSWYGRTRDLAKGTPVHHWAIPQKAMTKGSFLEVAGNQPWNLMPMESRAFHNAVHGWGPNAFNLSERVWYGSPTWAKVLGADLAGKGVNAGFDNDCGCEN